MALKLTFAALKQGIEHVLGGNPDTRTSKGMIVNLALDHLFNVHPWRWRQRHTTLNFTASQDYIELPEDFGEMVQLLGKEAKYTSIRPLSPELWALASVHGVNDTLALGYLIEAQDAAVATSTPRYVMKLAPTPASTQANALLMVYRSQPTTFITNDALTTDDNKYPNVPAGPAMSALYFLCRAFARSIEEDGSGDWALATERVRQAIEADSRAASVVQGHMSGTLIDDWFDGGGILHRPHTEIRMVGDP